jgi:NAD(P)-dependent dehydrogenase (short-subunit alcohol dehydrogenase family)
MKQQPMQAALVTGAGKRIGRFLAEALAADGWFVYVHYNASRAEASETVAAIKRAGGQAKAVRADLSTVKATEALVGQCQGDQGGPPLTCLVNSASLFELDRPGDFTAAQWDRHQAINLRAPAILARDFARLLPVGRTGCIVNLLDQKLWNLNPDFYSYTVSKVGLAGVTEILARSLAPRVRVNAIAPGITLPALKQSEKNFRAAQARAPLGIGATPDDLVRALRFILATPSLTGETIIVDGGEHLGKRPGDVMFERKP